MPHLILPRRNYRECPQIPVPINRNNRLTEGLISAIYPLQPWITNGATPDFYPGWYDAVRRRHYRAGVDIPYSRAAWRFTKKWGVVSGHRLVSSSESTSYDTPKLNAGDPITQCSFVSPNRPDITPTSTYGSASHLMFYAGATSIDYFGAGVGNVSGGYGYGLARYRNASGAQSLYGSTPIPSGELFLCQIKTTGTKTDIWVDGELDGSVTHTVADLDPTRIEFREPTYRVCYGPAFAWRRALSDDEMHEFGHNPFSIFGGYVPRTYFFPASAGGPTTYPWTATGGATLSGTATLAKVKNFVGTGSMSLDGSASLAKWKNFVGTGGSTLTGTATTAGPSNAYGYLYFMSRPRVSGVRPV